MLENIDYVNAKMPYLSILYSMSFYGVNGFPRIEEVDENIRGLPTNRIKGLYARLSQKVELCEEIFGINGQSRRMLDHFEVAIMN